MPKTRPARSPGSIPAHAGEPPRIDLRVIGATGRSPRTRGSPRARQSNPVDPGSIPAHAGEPGRRRPGMRPPRVDPRARGGAHFRHHFDVTGAGRSPRTRGSLQYNQYTPTIVGSIPAHAGEPFVASLLALGLQVDPRARGGAGSRWRTLRASRGRSPRTRGSPVDRRLPDPARGSIPAHAGEPPRHRPAVDSRTVDPRARGGAS